MERRGSWLQQWREPYLQALAMSWPVFLALVAVAYGAINALFAVLYRLDPTGIAFGRCFEDMLEHQADATHIHWESLDRTSPCSLTG